MTCRGQQRVSPFYHISQIAYSEAFHFRNFSSPGFPMQSRQATSRVLSLHRETNFIIGFDFAVIPSPDSSCVLFDITSEQSVELKCLM